MEDIYSDSEVYHPLNIIGKGTFGMVLQCWRASDGELVATKALSTESQRGNLITNELRLTAALDQTDMDRSHIVRFFESFCHNSHQYLVFELLEKNLYELQEENDFRPMPVHHIRTISCQLLRALVKLKAMSIIHADIKPENIMIVDQVCFPFRVKLIDFGSGRFLQEVCLARQPYIQSRFYRSPEILLGLPFCEKVDMWSLGCVMAELYLGWPLYPGPSESEQVRYICETQGLPSSHLLNMATKTPLFFSLVKTVQGNLVWQLRPNGQRTGPDGVQEGGTLEQRKYVLRSLDQLYNVHGPEYQQAFKNADAAAEAADRWCMVELIKLMLTTDSHCRINPGAALRHPFIALTHLRGSKTRYCDDSLKELQKALISKRLYQGHSEEPQLPPPLCRDCKGLSKVFCPELRNQSKPDHQCSEGDHHGNQKIPNQPCHKSMRAADTKCHETRFEIQDFQALETHKWTLDQVQNTTEKLEQVSTADTGGQESRKSGWFGDVVVQTHPHFFHVEHGLANVPPKCPQPEPVSMLTSLNHTTQPIRQSRSCFHHANVLFQVDIGNTPSTASSGVSQMFLKPPSPPKCDDPPQFFTAEMLPDQELLAHGQNTH